MARWATEAKEAGEVLVADAGPGGRERLLVARGFHRVPRDGGLLQSWCPVRCRWDRLRTGELKEKSRGG